MHRLARQLKAEIDTKLRAFEQLIQMADEARARLDADRARGIAWLERETMSKLLRWNGKHPTTADSLIGTNSAATQDRTADAGNG